MLRKLLFWVVLLPLAAGAGAPAVFLPADRLVGRAQPELQQLHAPAAGRTAEEQSECPLKFEWVDYERISGNLKRAIIASEDANFSGMKASTGKRCKRPTKRTRSAARSCRGGSTITQQLAKNLFLSGERSYLRKGQEVVIAYMLEYWMDKERIFEIYLNVVEWGNGVFGARGRGAAITTACRRPPVGQPGRQAGGDAAQPALLRRAPAVALPGPAHRADPPAHGFRGAAVAVLIIEMRRIGQRRYDGRMTGPACFQGVLRRSAFVPCYDLPAHGLVSTLALFLFPENPTWVVPFQTGSHRRMAGRRVSAAEFPQSPLAMKSYGGRAHQRPYRPRSLILFQPFRAVQPEVAPHVPTHGGREVR